MIGNLFLLTFCNKKQFQKQNPTLASDELTAVKKNLQTQNIDVDNEMVSARKQFQSHYYTYTFVISRLNKFGIHCIALAF